MEKKKAKGFRVPHTYVLLIGVMLFMALLTWIVPAGQFERVEVNDRTIVVPGSWAPVEQVGQTFFDVINAIPRGLVGAAEISIFIFLIGGAFTVINETGTVEAVIAKISSKLQGKESLVIPAFLLLFGVAGATLGFSEETIVFIPMGISLALALGFDAIVGMSMVAIGAAIGFSAGFLNPFSVGVAQGIAELPTFSGIGLRIILFIVLWIVSSLFIMRYAQKVKKNPTESLVYSEYRDIENAGQTEATRFIEMTKKHVLVGLIFLAGMITIAFGVIQFQWFIQEIGAIFMVTGIIAGFVYGYGPSKIADLFVAGAKDMVFAALIVGVARSIVIVMEDGMIIDTIVNALASIVDFLPGALAAIAMYIIQIIINFIIPSGSGQAAATMPLMVPLADAVDITRQTAVMAYQLGSGFMDSIMITSGVLMAQLSIARIPYNKWVKFLAPLMAIWLIIGALFLIFAHYTNYGPF